MKKKFSLSVICAFIFSCILPGQQFEWAKHIGGNGDDFSLAIAVDASDNTYYAGGFAGTVDFDPTSATLNYTAFAQDIFVTKYDVNGNMLWVKVFAASSGGGLAAALALDQNGNLYITGVIEGIIDFDPGPATANLTTSGETDVFVCKLDPNGTFMWARIMGGVAEDVGYTLVVDNNNDVYVTGFYRGTADFDPGPGTFNLVGQTGENLYVCKLSSAGNLVWAKNVSGTSYGYGLALDGNGGLYVTGYFEGTQDFDPNAGVMNLTSNGDKDCFLLKMDTNGNLLWGKSYGGTGEDHSNAMKLDAAGNIYTTGSFNTTVDFDPGTSAFSMNATGIDAYLLKLDASGNFLFAKQITGPDKQVSFSIDLDAAGNIYLTGSFVDATDFDPGPGTYTITPFTSERNTFVARLNTSGNLSWAVQLGVTGEGMYVRIDHAGHIYTTGYFYNTGDYDPGPGVFNLNFVGGVDIFLHKMSQGPIGIGENINVSGFQLYPNPATGEIYIIPGQQWETYRIVNMLGEVMQQGNNSSSVSVQDLSPGFYLFQVINSKGEMSQEKFMKL
jgi:hypothetical protein